MKLKIYGTHGIFSYILTAITSWMFGIFIIIRNPNIFGVIIFISFILAGIYFGSVAGKPYNRIITCEKYEVIKNEM